MPISLPLSPQSGLPLDPMTLQALQEQQLSNQVAAGGGTATWRSNNMAAQQAISSLFPSPAVQQAAKVQQALKQAQVTQQPGESQLDFNIRQLQAQRDAVAQYSPESAAALNTQLTKLAAMKFEQSQLVAADQRANEAETDKHNAAVAELPEQQAAGAFARATGTTGYLVRTDPNGKPQFTPFDSTNPDALAAVQKQAQQTGGIILPADKAADIMKSYQTGMMGVQRAITQANIEYGQFDPDTIRHAAIQAIFDPSSVIYRGPEKALIQKWYTENDIQPSDIASAKIEYKALQTAAGRAGAREGNMQTLENSISPLGDQVISALGGVTRYDATFVNKAVRYGKSAFSDPGEAKLAAALQSYVNEYARVINGGTGMTSDAAREDAMKVLNQNLGPAGMKAGINQLSKVETQVITNASDSAVEMLSNPNKYRSLVKIQQKAGLNVLPTQGDSSAAATPNPTPSSPSPNPNPPAAPQGGLPPGWTVQAH